ncbi:MAG TPA: DNA primase [Thermoleophilaceae bacterium]|nr:DNA primase [Thermoleophilaceae bacterium]
MARYTQDSIERLRESIDMVGLVGSRTDLRRVGSRWVGLCPFHEERTPSFSVNAEQGLYHCFGCGEGGDAISFVRETEQLDFAEAVELLAERFNVELKREREDPQEEERRRRRGRLLALLERTTAFYEKYLWESDEARAARDYLAGRGLSQETLREFRVGWSPSGWDKLLAGAERDGFSLDDLIAAGLAQPKRSGKGGVDRFRERIMFPLADSRGRVLGFGARAMSDEQGAKYINTSENEIYHKGRQLFGIDKARAVAAKSGRVVVVEGYTDVLALHQAGVGETVAIMGTALTEHQLSELARAAGAEGVVYLALDADRAGQQAMLRAAKIAEQRDIELRVVQMPEGADPAELVAAQGADAILGKLDDALSVRKFAVLRVLADARIATAEGRERAIAQASELISETQPGSALRADLVNAVADRLQVPDSYVVTLLRDSTRSSARRPPAAAFGDPGPEHHPGSGTSTASDGGSEPSAGGGASVAAGPGAAALEAERVFLALCLAAGSVGREYLDRLQPEHLSSASLRRARKYLSANFDDPLAELDPDDAELAGLVAGIAVRAEEGEPAEEPLLRMSFLALELRRIDREVRRARQEGDLESQVELANARQRVRRDMDAVMGQAT